MTTREAGSAHGAVPGEDLVTPSLLLDGGKGRRHGTPAAPMDKDLSKLVADRASKFIIRGLSISLWLYLFNFMRDYAISYTGGDTRFSTFAAIVVAVPIAEFFGIVGQALVPPPSSSPPIGSSSSMPADAMRRAAMEIAQDKADIEAALAVAAPRIHTCIVRALLVLLWVFLVDLMRRYIATQGVGVLLFTMPPLLILAAGVTAFLCRLMECCRQLTHLTKSSQYGATLELVD